MNTGLKPTGIIERKNNPDNKMEYNSNLMTLKIIPVKISSSKGKDKKSFSRPNNNEIQKKNKFIVTTDFSIKDNEKKNVNPGKKSKSNNNELKPKFIITTDFSNENKENKEKEEKENIKNYPIFMIKIESSKLNIYNYNYIIFFLVKKNMTDYELINILDKYLEKEKEIESSYNIKKEALEKDYQNQKKNNRIQLLNSLFKKEEDIKSKLKGLKNHLEGINQIRNILSENKEKKGTQKLKIMLNDSQVNLVYNDIHLREEEDIQIQEENNGMKQSEEEESEEIENIEEEPKKNAYKKKKEDCRMTDSKRKRPSSGNNN